MAKIGMENCENGRMYNISAAGENSEVIMKESKNAIMSDIYTQDEIKRKNWQDNVILYIFTGIVIAVISDLIL